MISVIYGAKGSGKTKRIIDAANSAGEKSLGQVVFVTDNDKSLSINSNVRFVNIDDYGIKTEEEFIGFLKGMLATNFDIHNVFIDGLCRFFNVTADALKPVFDTMDALDENVEFVATVSTAELPAFLKKYAK